MGTDAARTKSQASVSSVVGPKNNKPNERKNMNTKFDELTKAMAQSVTRRAALTRFGVGLAGMVLVAFGLPDIARADKVKTTSCATDADCASGQVCCNSVCVAGIPDWCDPSASCCCYCTGKGKNKYMVTALPTCHPSYNTCSHTCLVNGGFWGCGPAPV
jgi:hypothetical protein